MNSFDIYNIKEINNIISEYKNGLEHSKKMRKTLKTIKRLTSSKILNRHSILFEEEIIDLNPYQMNDIIENAKLNIMRFLTNNNSTTFEEIHGVSFYDLYDYFVRYLKICFLDQERTNSKIVDKKILFIDFEFFKSCFLYISDFDDEDTQIAFDFYLNVHDMDTDYLEELDE
jgi:hypothetical protein